MNKDIENGEFKYSISSITSTVFEFNFWRFKNFGETQNFICFNDDYFVGKPLKKSDFYQYNGKKYYMQ